MTVVKTITTFFSRNCTTTAPVLLALSGGPDSLALFYGLIESKIPFHVAHVDHGWREESQAEAADLQQLAAQCAVPFHLKTLDPATLKGNLEMACRLERYRFFSALCGEHALQGVFVGHHKDDQAETVLKRVLEGSHWSCLSGLASNTIIEGVTVFRPFLSLSKNQLLKYLEDKEFQALEDKTNHDDRFLRARMRQTIFPWLNQNFGKEIQPALIRLGNEMDELRSYFDQQLDPILNKVVCGPFGSYLDVMPKTIMEAKFLLRKFCGSLSYSQLEQAAVAWMEGAANKTVGNKKERLIIDRQRLFLIKNDVNWSYEFVESHYVECSMTDWKDIWKGYSEAFLPLGEYQLKKWSEVQVENKRSVDKRWTSGSIPAFLRDQVPVICDGSKIVHEFLTGRSRYSFQPGEKVLKIKIVGS